MDLQKSVELSESLTSASQSKQTTGQYNLVEMSL